MTGNWQYVAHVARLDRFCIFNIVIFTFLPFLDSTALGYSKRESTKDSGYSSTGGTR